MKKGLVISCLFVAALAGSFLIFGKKSNTKSITVYQSPSCGCCKKWVKHLEDSGLHVNSEMVSDVTEVKQKLGLPLRLASCHTALIDGYIVEGHVPVKAIEKLLKEKPAIKGISVPGMPMGSPGMEGPHEDNFDVVSFRENGEDSIFMSHKDL